MSVDMEGYAACTFILEIKRFNILVIGRVVPSSSVSAVRPKGGISMEMMPIHPLPTQTSPRPVMPDGPLFRYIRVLQQVTGIYRWSHLRVVLYLLDSPSLPDDCFLGTYNKIAWETGACSQILAEAMQRACRENPGRGLEDPSKTYGGEKRFLPGVCSRRFGDILRMSAWI